MSGNVACNLEIGSTVQVKCTAGKGMFPHELGVLLQGKDQFYEAMIDAELVQLTGEPNDDGERPASVGARVVSVNCENVLVELPRQVVTGGRRIWVPKSEVTADGDSLAASD
jgi:hypothetical protein